MIERQRYWRTPLDARQMARTCGDVFVIDDRCKGCGFCVEYCPREVLVLAKTFNRKGYHPPRVAKAGHCVNCNLCEMLCPEFAIFSFAVESRPAASAPPAVHGGAS
jgi:2-oxoglutarate ferredoxin oxidoreductase subunit delta